MTVLDVRTLGTQQSPGTICWVTIDRPAALNAINAQVMTALEALLTQLEAPDADIRVLVIQGAGARAFVSGGDLREFAPLKTKAQAEQMARQMRAILDRIERLPCWSIGCVNGDAYGGGCEFLAALDHRVASSDARLGWTQARFHLTPGWGGLTRLVELVGRPTAARWLGLAQPVSAQAAQAAGFIDEVVEPDALLDAVRALAERLALQDRALIGAIKRGLLAALELPRSASIEAELDPFTTLWAAPAHHERVARFLAPSAPSPVTPTHQAPNPEDDTP